MGLFKTQYNTNINMKVASSMIIAAVSMQSASAFAPASSFGSSTALKAADASVSPVPVKKRQPLLLLHRSDPPLTAGHPMPRNLVTDYPEHYRRLDTSILLDSVKDVISLESRDSEKPK